MDLLDIVAGQPAIQSLSSMPSIIESGNSMPFFLLSILSYCLLLASIILSIFLYRFQDKYELSFLSIIFNHHINCIVDKGRICQDDFTNCQTFACQFQLSSTKRFKLHRLLQFTRAVIFTASTYSCMSE